MKGATRHKLVREVLLPAAAVTAGIAALGRVVMGPLDGFTQEDVVNRVLQQRRSPGLDRITWAVSTYSDVVPTIASSLVYGGLAYRVTRDWRQGVAPLAAIALETTVFMSAAAVTGRERPGPPVEWLDTPAPTSSFPSGHTAATTAMHSVIGTLLTTNAARAAFVAPALRWGWPPLVAWSRLYRGMHHPSDVVVGMALGHWSARTVRRALDLG